MTAWDDFQGKIECICCGRVGTAVLRQSDGYAFATYKETSLRSSPVGFRPSRFAQGEDGPHLDCVACDVPALS